MGFGDEIKDVEQDFSGSGNGQQGGSSDQQQQQQQSSGGGEQQQQGGQSSSTGGGMKDELVDSGIDEFAQKEGMSAGLDPEVNAEANKFVNDL